MANRSRDIYKKSYPDIEWSIPNAKSVLQSGHNTIKRPPLEFCDGNWILMIYGGRNCMYFDLYRELFTGQHLGSNLAAYHDFHKIFISVKSFLVKENGKEFPLLDCLLKAENMDFLKTYSNGMTRYKTALFQPMSWMDLQETDGLKIICKFRCMDCPVKLAYIPILSDHRHDTLKRKNPEEQAMEPDGSKMKMLCLSGADALLRDIKKLLTSGEDSDVTIQVKDREFRAHKNILRVRSPVFFKMFSHDWYEKKNGIIDITDCEPDAFQEFLNFLYSGELDNVPINIVFNLYYIGDKYEVEEVKRICVSSMSRHLSVETFCEIFTLAQLYKESMLLETASEFFIKNLKAIIATDKWLAFLIEHPVTANKLHLKAAGC